jgi:LPS-assembly protein
MGGRGVARALAAALVLAAPMAAAQDRERVVATDQPFLLTADELIYDETLGTVTARGQVEIAQGPRTLLADAISYSLRDGIVTASGNISLLEPNGDVVFADYMQLDKELTEGFIRNVRVLMADESRLAANEARRFPGERTELSQAVYSPCRACPDRAPTWQIKAGKVTHDKLAQEIRYEDAVFEAFGVPIAYTPYFSHSDPSVKRRSGLLAPNFGSSSDLGLRLTTPYFWALAPSRDLTIAPTFTSREGVVLAGEYREATRTGEFDVEFSGTHVDKRDENGDRLDDKEFRGHVKANGRFDIDPVWRWGFDVFRATDDTYLNRYDLSDEDTLTSDLFVEGLRGRNYASLSGFAFQGLRREDDSGTTPYVLPLADYSFVGLPSERTGGRFAFDANLVSLYRTQGPDTRRLSGNASWALPYVGPAGDLWTLTAALRADGYWLNDVFDPLVGTAAQDRQFEGRAEPMVALEWSYPMVRNADSVRQVIEPIAQAIWQPYDGEDDKIPNEDSQNVEFDDTNLFGFSRFPGYDRLEDGPRLNYGVKLGAYGAGGGSATALFGQVLRLKKDRSFGSSTGLDDERSDYVARVSVSPGPWLDLVNRTRIDRDLKDVRRNEVYLGLGPEKLRFAMSYVLLDRDLLVDQVESTEELYLFARAQLSRYWSMLALSRRDLADDGRQITTGLGVRYEDECVVFEITFDRDYTRDRDVEPSSSVNFRILLVNLS